MRTLCSRLLSVIFAFSVGGGAALSVLLGHSAALASPANILVAEGRTEPVIAVNPHNPQDLVGGSNPNYSEQYPLGLPVSTFSSQDGGRSWQVSDMPLRSPYTVTADPSVAFDNHGTSFFLYLGESPTFCSAGSSAVLLSRSTDNGTHYSVPVFVDSGGGFHDKPYLAVQSFPHRPDHIFVVWDRWQAADVQLFVQRSVDGGWHFSAPVMIAQSPWFNFGAIPVVTKHGRVTVVWATFPKGGGSQPLRERIVARTSHDDGVHWGPTMAVSGSYFWGMPNLLLPGGLRMFDIPTVVATSKGALYVAWSVVRLHEASGGVLSDIMLTRSTDGVHWSPPTRVNDTLRGDRFMPTVSALPDGSAAVAFYDRRRSRADLDLYAAHVAVAGSALIPSANVRINSGSSPVKAIYYVPDTGCLFPGRFFGDYISSASDADGVFHVIWADTRRHAQATTDIWTASMRFTATARYGKGAL